MNTMEIIMQNEWMWFVVLMAIALITTILMSMYARNFRTHFGSTRRFSIVDLEFPSSKKDFQKIVNGIYRLPNSEKIFKALRMNLLVDFFFMPAMYGSVFILCMAVSNKMTSDFGESGFELFAWLQILAWALDIVENIFILSHLKHVKMDSSYVDSPLHGYKIVVHTKWIIALLGGICSSMVLLCFWLEGNFDTTSLKFILILVFELILTGFFLWKIGSPKIEKSEISTKA